MCINIKNYSISECFTELQQGLAFNQALSSLYENPFLTVNFGGTKCYILVMMCAKKQRHKKGEVLYFPNLYWEVINVDMLQHAAAQCICRSPDNEKLA